MESNADKHLRDKLQGLQMPYDPAAWEQMEAMLDKKKKRRGFFWWWTGGIAAAVLLTGGTYLFMQQAKQDNPTTTQQTALNNTVASNNKAGTGVTGTGQSNSHAQNTTTETSNATVAQNPEGNNTSSVKKNYTGKQEAASQNQKEGSKSKNQRAGHTNSKNNKPATTTTKQATKQKAARNEENELFAATAANPNAVKEVTSLQQQSESVILPGSSAQENKEVVSAPVTEETNGTKAEVQETAVANAPTADSTAQQANSTNQQQKAARKSGFSYQLGIRTDLMATMAPVLLHAEKRFDTLSVADKKGPVTFTVSAGLFNEFNFINRISVYMGVLYTRSTFQVNRPRVSESMNYADSTYRTYNSYTAQQHQIDIPIGLKVYPYIGSKVRFSVGFGIINHIKLKETFIAHTTQTPVANLSAALDVPFTYTSNNPFEVKNSTADVSSGVANHSQNEEPAYFGSNGYSRYYLSVYASLGAEFILAKKYSLLVEPLYYFAAQKMGEQQRRKHNVGLSLGFKYNFGTR